MPEFAPNTEPSPSEALGAAATGSLIERVPTELQASTQPDVAAVKQPIIDHAPGFPSPMGEDFVMTPAEIAQAKAGLPTQEQPAPEQAPPFNA